jgi:hypothetical protein
LEWPDMGTSTAFEFAVSLAAKGEYSTYVRGLSTTPGFPTSGCWRRPRVRFSLKKTA